MTKILNTTEEKILVEAIAVAEKNTSGEIRVHIEKACKGEVLERAKVVFEKLGMTATEARNGVLIYIAEESHKFAILGDAGIHEKVGADFWDHSKDLMLAHFKKGEFVEGIKEAVLSCGEALKKHFPYQKNDSNELSNDISYEN
jgi:uncharacterized membrane protein